MKNNQLTSVLLGLLLLSTVATCWLIYRYISSIHEIQRLQQEVMGINVLQSLGNEAAEYGKTHPDMARLLQPYTVGARPMPNAAPTAKPQPPK